MVFKVNNDAKAVEMLPGVVRRTLNSSDQMTLVEVAFEAGAVVPMHEHMHEQIGYVASGRFLFEVGGEARELAAGDSYLVHGHTPHRVTALEAGIAVDIFCPQREEYLDR